MIRVLVVLGTRPEAIKLSPVIHEARRKSDRLSLNVLTTGQHREMVRPVLERFGVVPDFDLDLMTPDQTLSQVASSVLSGLDPILREEKPDWVLVQGDTTTAAAAAQAAAHRRVAVGHVEAGLRSGDRAHPFPEELNRRLIGVLADLHFAPTVRAERSLRAEGVDFGRILRTGNTAVDALEWMLRQPERPEERAALDRLGLKAGVRTMLVTAHRRESFGPPLESICLAVRDLAARFGDRLRVIYPTHLNPSVRETARRVLGSTANVHLADPLDYPVLLRAMAASDLILTDSGGIQEEAPSLGVPVLVLRDVTERPEAIEAGTARLVGTGRERIVAEASRVLEGPRVEAASRRNPFGDGRAAERIVAALLGESGPPPSPSP